MLDEWFECDVHPRLPGQAFLIRYADDFVIGFACAADARRVLEVLPKRFGKYGLALHPDQTRLVPFTRPSARSDSEDGGPRPGTLALLGFTHYWGRSRRGVWVVQRRTASTRFSRAVWKIAAWCRQHRHLPLAEPQQALGRKLRGHDAYDGITGNCPMLQRLRQVVVRLWRKWLSRRSRDAPLSWARFRRLLGQFPLPPARVVHPVYRLAAKPLT